MVINGYHITKDSAKALEQSQEFLESWQQSKGSYWVDIHSYEIDELKAWLANLNLSDPAMKCCLEAGHSTRFIPLRNALFFEFSVYPGNMASEPVPLSFLCIENLVLTLHSDPLESFEGAIKGLTSEMTLLEPTTSALVCFLCLLESVKVLKISETLKKSVFDLDDRMDDNPDSVEAGEILGQKRSLRTLETVVTTQIFCFGYMGGLSRPFLDMKPLTAQFQLAPSNVNAANQDVNRLEKAIADIRQRFGMNQQEKTNHRLAILTILSAIFMPLTFIAGIYGMNFERMPELHLAFGYPVVLIVMTLIAGGMYLYFKTKGWLK